MSEVENNNQKFNGIVIIPLLMGVALAAGLFLGTFFIKDGGFADPVQENTNKFNTILEFIEDNYVDSVDHDLLIESSIEGMIKKLDPHSAYIPARDLAEVNEQLEGNFGGIGIRFLIHHDTLVATHVLKGSPAEQAGMKAGDRILEVDDTVIANMGLSNERVMELLKGEVGTKVEVKIFRKGETQKLSLTRGQIPISSIDAYLMLSDEVGFIKLNSFTFSAGEEFNAAASDLKSRGMKKLIFDLRNNGGGSMSAATEIADQFLESGKLIVYTEGRKEPREDYYATSRGILEDVEVIVLINSLSASASEIVAGAIQDNDRGLVMGRRSFGKGLVQTQEEFTDGSALRLTISRYYTPTGRSIQKPYGEGVDYESDYFNRFESGELMNEDSVKHDESLQYTTPAGRIVYGGGGIYPDVFIPNDTAGASYYLTELYYESIFNHYAVKYLDTKRETFKNFEKYLSSFTVSDAMFNEFISYATKLGVAQIPKDIVTSKPVIKNRIKAEIARHIWDDNGYYAVYLEDDLDVQRALKEFETGRAISQLTHPN